MIQRLVVIIFILQIVHGIHASDLEDQAAASLGKAVTFFHSINSHGGYVYYVTPDLSRRWGEGLKDEHTIEVQPPGTPVIGMAFLRAYKATGDKKALKAALDAAHALLNGQNDLGGWEHTINFAQRPGKRVSFDDNQTQSAISFLMALDQEIDDKQLNAGIDKALNLMFMSQLDHGGWPHKYPAGGDYHDYATFNDGGINDCVRVMIEAYQYYGTEEIEESLRKAARFIFISQLPPPQPGWAQQYNEYLQPAWARTFEPPAVCPLVTVKNLNTLIDLYLALGSRVYLEPIPDSLLWLEESRMENGKWARFIEIGTGKPLYYDRDRKRVDSVAELHIERASGYGYETDLSQTFKAVSSRYRKAMEMNREDLLEIENPRHTGEVAAKKMKSMAKTVREIIASQEESGAWITRNDRFKMDMPRNVRWNGEFEEADRISSAVFNRNVKMLCEYIELGKLSKIDE